MSVGYNDSVIMKYDNKQYAVALNILKDQICAGCSFPLLLSCAKIALFFFFQITLECNDLTRECLSEENLLSSHLPCSPVFSSRHPDPVGVGFLYPLSSSIPLAPFLLVTSSWTPHQCSAAILICLLQQCSLMILLCLTSRVYLTGHFLAQPQHVPSIILFFFFNFLLYLQVLN